MKWTWQSKPPAVRILPSPAIASVAGPDHDVDAGLGVRVARLADAGDPPVPDPDVGLDDAGVVEDQGVGDHGVDRARLARRLRLAHAVADHLAAAELDLLAIDRAVLLDLDEQLGVGEPHPVADRGPVHVGIGRAPDLTGHQEVSDASSAPAHQTIEAEDPARPGDRHELDLAGLAGLEADRRAGRNVEPAAAGRGAIERERRVGLEEVVVRADLHRTVAGVGDRERDRLAARVQGDLAVARDDFARDHADLPSGSAGAR